MTKHNTTVFMAMLIVGTISLAGCTGITDTPPPAPVADYAEGEEVVLDVNLQDDFTGAKIAEADLLQGCFSQDCIPSLDEPVFETVAEANTWLEADDRVFAIEVAGIEKVYPQRILNWHEIVNDEINDTRFAVTFCPLCGSVTAFHREVNGTDTEFGVSGKLHNSDLVMYDRLEGNLWQQVTGEAIVGPAALRDERLQELLLTTTTWAEWSTAHPDSQVLSRETGYTRNYDQYPYGTYESNDELLFGVEDLNTGIQIKTPVYGITVNGTAKAYQVADIEAAGTITDTVGGELIEITTTVDGSVLFTQVNQEPSDHTQAYGITLDHIRLFWFAWAAFNPDTELYSS